jgi:hypothetical protein
MQSPRPIGPAGATVDNRVVSMSAYRAKALLGKPIASEQTSKPVSPAHSVAAFGEMLSDLD